MGDEVLQEAVQKCREMGLHCSEDEIRNALRQCNGKLEDAMPLLLTDSPQCDSNLLHEYNVITDKPFHEREDSFERDVDMRDTETHPGSGAESDKDSTTVSYSVENLREMGEEGEVDERGDDMSDIPPRPEGPPPSYEDINNEESVEEDLSSPPEMEDGGPEKERENGEAVVHSLQEGRVFGCVMLATINMIREGPGIAEADENCRKFLQKTMPDAFNKVLTHEAVLRWDVAIIEGIANMCKIALELIAERLKQPPIPVYLLDLLAVIFNSDTNFHNKLRNRKADSTPKGSHVFAQMPSYQLHKDPKGCLVDMMNTLKELTALFLPLSLCEDYINAAYLKSEFLKCIMRAVKFVRDLTTESLKEKDVGCVSDLLRSVKSLSVRCSSWDVVNTVDSLRLETTARMINTPHFNAKMNALKEVVRLTEEPYQAVTRGVKNPISSDKVVEWLVSNRILSIALGGNLHQTQYCDKIKSLLEFLGTKLTVEELEGIWVMQADKNPVQVENVHGILAAAASRFPPALLDHLFQLIQKSWETASDRYREKLIDLIGKIGKDDRQGKTASKILEVLWSLAHLPQSSRVMVELALEAHTSILIDSSHTKEPEKRNYIVKCVEDIRKATWVVSAFQQLHKYIKGFCRTSYASGHTQKDQHQVSELQRQYDLLRLTSVTLTKCHSNAVQFCKERNIELTGEIITDGRYSHYECVDTHLKFIAFLLKEGALYMPAKRACEVWDTLIANPHACDADRRLGFKWFDEGLADMEAETQSNLFNARVLKVDPAVLDTAGYQCLRRLFEIVEIPELTGIEYLWRAAMEVRDWRIADELITNILQISYQALSPKLKKDVVTLHHRFIDECFRRLDELLGGAPKAGDQTRVQSIERLLLLIQRYIKMVEESYSLPRQLPPHGASFHGHPLTLTISLDQPKQEFRLSCHSNESICSVRQKVAKQLNVTPEQVQIGTTEHWLDISDYNKLIHQLGFTDHQTLIVKTQSFVSSSSYVRTEGLQPVLEKSEGKRFTWTRASPPWTHLGFRSKDISAIGTDLLPRRHTSWGRWSDGGVLRSKLIRGVRSVLLLIPTDPRVRSSLEGFSHHSPKGASDDTHTSLLPPDAILKDYLDASRISPYQLLYNMEVLSSHLMPVVSKETDDASAKVFRRNFLEAGGLKYVISVLQSKALPTNVDLSVRQDCYAMALSVARFLLYNEVALPLVRRQVSSVVVEGGAGTGDGEDRPPANHEEPKALEQATVEPKALKSDDPEDVARLTIETMSVSDFTTVVGHLVRVIWGAAAGKLHLASEHREGENQLRAGLCAEQMAGAVDSKNTAIACEALELLVTCLNLRRSMLDAFYELPNVREFIMDVLLGCPSDDVRVSAVELLCQLCAPPKSHDASSVPESKRPRPSAPVTTPHHFFLHLVLEHPTSLWEVGSEEQGVGSEEQGDHLDQWTRSFQYFEFRSRLLQNLKVEEQKELGVDVIQLLKNELDWISRFKSCSWQPPALQCVLTGHLKLCRALFTCEGVDKKSYGHELINDLISVFLFSASKLICSEGYSGRGIVDINPRCTDLFSRVAAFDLIVELCSGCYDNLVLAASQLINLHHVENPDMAKEWECVMCPAPSVGVHHLGYVDLKNAGTTCYIECYSPTAVHAGPCRDLILGVDTEESEEQSILFDLQTIFGHLRDSKLQSFSPDGFLKNFKLRGEPVNVREQQDAHDFFCDLTDQIDEHLKRKSLQQVFSAAFGGFFLDQKICKGCEHTYDREESFLSLSLPVKSKTLEEALKEFVKGDMLEGENAYLCEKCQEKRDTVKRTCIKTLPPTLVVQLKRFGFDWEANRAIKFDDHFESCDLSKVHLEYQRLKPFFHGYWTWSPTRQRDWPVERRINTSSPKQLYDLTGIVVHSGQASAGHYYSFIKDKRSPAMSIAEDASVEVSHDTGCWLRFNDVVVDEFAMNQVSLESECFGGSYKAKTSDVQGSHPDMRVRFWNAYMLFYEARDHATKTRGVARADSTPIPASPHLPDDKLSQLQALVQRGDRRGVFSDTIPPAIQRSVNEENLQFMRHRDVYCLEYLAFVRSLVAANTVEPGHLEYGVVSLQLAINFLFHTYFRCKKRLRVELDIWITNVERILMSSQEACVWFVDMMGSAKGSGYLKPFLLDCTSKEVRAGFCRIMCCAVNNYCVIQGKPEGPVECIIECLLKLLNRDVVENCKNCGEYFELFRSYASLPFGCQHLLKKDVFVQMVRFLLGPSAETSDAPQEKPGHPKHWSSSQMKEFSPLHCTISLLIRNCDISPYETETEEGHSPANPYMVPSSRADLQRVSEGMFQALFLLDNSKMFISECVQSLRECDSQAVEAIAGTFCYCCWNNQSISACVVQDLQNQIHELPPNELKPYFKVLTDILVMKDLLQQKRISFAITGGKYQPNIAIFSTMRASSGTGTALGAIGEPKRAYQVVKFLVGLANKTKPARDYLLEHCSEWQWAVPWLRKKLQSAEYSWPYPSLSNESSSTRTFQRTVSAQDTLEEANALLNELEACDLRQAPPPMAAGSSQGGSEGPQQQQQDRVEG
eukprot:Em0011g1159a